MRPRDRDGAGGQRRPDPKPRRRAGAVRGPARAAADRKAGSRASTTAPGRTGAALGGQKLRHVFSALVVFAVASVASAQVPPAQQAEQPRLRFFPVTRPTDPVGVIYASPAPGGRLLVFGATARPDSDPAQGGVYVPHGCPRAVAESGSR